MLWFIMVNGTSISFAANLKGWQSRYSAIRHEPHIACDLGVDVPVGQDSSGKNVRYTVFLAPITLLPCS